MWQDSERENATGQADFLKMIILVWNSGNTDQDSEADSEPFAKGFCSEMHG